MRTEKIGEDKGKIINVRVLDVSPDSSNYEISNQSKGSILGIDFEDFGTYVSTAYNDGREYGEGHGITTTKDGESLVWNASGMGKSGGKGFKGSYHGVLFYQSKSANPNVARLCKGPILFEYESDEEGNSRTTYYEWQ